MTGAPVIVALDGDADADDVIAAADGNVGFTEPAVEADEEGLDEASDGEDWKINLTFV